MSELVPSVRASDADRERVAAIVSAAAGQGMLTLEEADERLARVYASRHVAELAPITADLPDAGRRLAPVDTGARAAARAAFTRHLTLYLVGVTVLVAIWAVTGSDFFWPAWPIVGFGIGLVSHARAARRAGDPAYESPTPHAGAGPGPGARAVGPRPWGAPGPWAYGGCGRARHHAYRARA